MESLQENDQGLMRPELGQTADQLQCLILESATTVVAAPVIKAAVHTQQQLCSLQAAGQAGEQLCARHAVEPAGEQLGTLHAVEPAGEQLQPLGATLCKDGAVLQRAASDKTARIDGPDDLTCAICLEQVSPVDMATIKGCEHLYCVHCILQWSLCAEVARCPQCKSPFTFIFCHRLLDGTVVDFPVEETITLLKRAKWFEERLKMSEKGQAMLREAERRGLLSGGPSHDWQAEFYEDFEDEQDEDEEIEQFYFSAAAGRARVFGNRRLGENGFLKSGRQFARPLPQPTTPAPTSAKGKAKGYAASSSAGGSGSRRVTPGGGSCSAGGASGSGSSHVASTSPCGSLGSGSCVPAASSSAGKGGGGTPQAHGGGGEVRGGSGAKSVGRRASRKARRMVADDDDYDDDY